VTDIPIDVLSLGTVKLPPDHPRAGERDCPVQAFLVRHPDGPFLVDSGVADDHELINDLYRPTVVPVVDALNGAGIDERDLVGIVNTHLHFDHCGQNRSLSSVPVHVQAAELEASTEPLFTIPEWAHIHAKRRRVVHGDEEIATGVHLVLTPGHTPGHQSVLIEAADGERRLIVGQCCYSCGEFRTGDVLAADMHDESFIRAGAESLERLRALGPSRAHFSHDRTVFTDHVQWRVDPSKRR